VGERRIVPALGDPPRHVDDAERAQGLDQRQRRAVELAEHLVALQQILARPASFLVAAARQQPEILDGRAHHAIVEVDQDGAVAGPEDVAPVQVAVDALELDLGELRDGGLRDAQGDVAVAGPEVLGHEADLLDVAQRLVHVVLDASVGRWGAGRAAPTACSRPSVRPM